MFTYSSHYTQRIAFGVIAGFTSHYLNIDRFFITEDIYYSFEMNPLLLVIFIGGWLSGLCSYIVNLLLSNQIAIDHLIILLIVTPILLIKSWKMHRYRCFILIILSTALLRLLIIIPYIQDWVKYQHAILFQLTSSASLLLCFYGLTTKRKHISEIFTIRKTSLTDQLTGLNNRNAIEQQLSQLTEAQHPYSILFIDLDDFKKINDTYGHIIGDKCLTKLATLMQQSSRGQDFLGRYGGEEFLIIIKDPIPERALLVAERLRNLVEISELTFAPNITLKLTVSIGIACAADGQTFDSVLHQADLAMYRSKKQGKNCITLSNHP